MLNITSIFDFCQVFYSYPRQLWNVGQVFGVKTGQISIGKKPENTYGYKPNFTNSGFAESQQFYLSNIIEDTFKSAIAK